MDNIFSSALVTLFNTFSVPLFIVVFLCFLFLLLKSFLKGSSKANVASLYTLKYSLFSPAERSFLGVLNQAVSNDYYIFGKVRIADILEPQKTQDKKTRRVAFNRISSKHFDYLLCGKDTLSIVAVIELDDKSHRQNKTKLRDSFIEDACRSAGLTLIRFDCKSKYSIQDVRTKVSLSIS